MSDELPNPDDMSYGDALAELEAILAALERDSVDVDVLADKVRRAKALITMCRGRIESTRLEIEEIVGSADDE